MQVFHTFVQKIVPSMFKRILLAILLFGCTGAWLIATQPGLFISLRLVSFFTPYEINYKNAYGTIYHGFGFQKLTANYKENNVSIDKLFIKLKYQDLFKKKLSVQELDITQLILQTVSRKVELNTVKFRANITEDNWKIYLDNLEGKVDNIPLSARISLSSKFGEISLDADSYINFGNDFVRLKDNQQSIDLLLNVADISSLIGKKYPSKFILKAKIDKSYIINTKEYQGVLESIDLSPEFTDKWQLNHATKFRISSKIFKIDNIHLKSSIGSLISSINWQKRKHLNIKGKLKEFDGRLISQIYKNINLNSKINGDFDMQFAKKKYATANFELLPGILQLTQNNGQAIVGLKLSPSTVQYQRINNNASIEAKISTENSVAIDAKLDKRYDNIEGEIITKADDLSKLVWHVSDVSNISGKLLATTTFSGKLYDPHIYTKGTLDGKKVSLPNFGVMITPLYINFESDINKFTLQGYGKTAGSDGNFTINGYANLNKLEDHNFHIKGEDLFLVNTELYKLYGAPNVDLQFLDLDNLKITGDINLNRGTINFSQESHSAIKSLDIVFVDQQPTIERVPLNIIPDLRLHAENKLNFFAKNINALVTGKLRITSKQGNYYGEGRISLKEGEYKLPGQKMRIGKSRLEYSRGTLLVNPALDIKIYHPNDESVYIYLQGDINEPVISEKGLTGDEFNAFLQGFNASSSPVLNLIQDKFGLSELGLQEKITDTSLRGNKDNLTYSERSDIVLGKQLSNKLKLQYSHSITDAENRKVKLKYRLGKYFAVALDSNQLGSSGSGVDLEFAIDKN